MSLLLPAPSIHRFTGTLIGPEDDGYESARRVYNAMIDRRPALIARCESISDVAAALAHASDHGLEIAVRAGGHSSPGFATTDGGLVIDLTPLKAIQVDPVRRIAWVQPGVLWSELDAATQEHGLAVTGGRASSTGVAGFTLGSGSGWLERKMGLAADNLRAARVLTADGHVVKASASENPDLFWALRGGGGNFGIVLEFEFGLRPVGPIVLGGMLLWPRERAGEVMRAYRDLMAEAPDALCGGLALMTAPAAPMVPYELQGRPAVGVVVLYVGDVARGAEHVGRLRALAPAVDAVQPMPYCAVQSMMDKTHPEGLRDYYRAAFLDELTDAAVDTIVAGAENAPSTLSAVLLQPLGGAFGRVGEMDTALGHRDAAWGIQVLAQWLEPERDTTNRNWVRALTDALAPWARPAGFPNFIADAAVPVAYGAERHARLVEAKDRWDPTNVFRLNHNIRPSA
ncbi:MAG TPA: FAD-binding oxidoreductase [Solirubrobacteraceae bacterium]|nr:FAD-binding oxidoreductase [Solirubrobacteraceae bacterium]